MMSIVTGDVTSSRCPPAARPSRAAAREQRGQQHEAEDEEHRRTRDRRRRAPPSSDCWPVSVSPRTASAASARICAEREHAVADHLARQQRARRDGRDQDLDDAGLLLLDDALRDRRAEQDRGMRNTMPKPIATR